MKKKKNSNNNRYKQVSVWYKKCKKPAHICHPRKQPTRHVLHDLTPLVNAAWKRRFAKAPRSCTYIEFPKATNSGGLRILPSPFPRMFGDNRAVHKARQTPAQIGFRFPCTCLYKRNNSRGTYRWDSFAIVSSIFCYMTERPRIYVSRTRTWAQFLPLLWQHCCNLFIYFCIAQFTACHIFV